MSQVIKLTDRSFIREHPFGDPFTSPFANSAYEAMYRYIYPGDELLPWHRISLPGDFIGNVEMVNPPTMSDINFLSAKLSIIAKKPQVYSEEYSSEYKATRVFTLDSFQTTFNNSNATMQLWGADGYARNIHLAQDRAFKLPAGNLFRQIKFFTDHTPSTSNWDYYFYFPILWRWEYWLGLLNVHADFFDLTQPQNGQNHWWYHYFTSTWKLFSRLELEITVFGQPYRLRSELALTPGVGDVNDYNSNTDYISKSVKTGPSTGAVSNTPALIYGNTDTKVIASLDKVIAWGFGEKANVSAVVWLEPFEGAGVTERTRGSSTYPITPESVFKGLDIGAADTNGLNITDGAGSFVVLNPAGAGAKVLFDLADDTKVTIAAIIDYQKLAAVCPGITKFTVYARLYNNTALEADPVYSRLKGEEIKIDAQLVKTAATATICERRLPDCEFALDVFADLSDADELKNDRSSFLGYGDELIERVELILIKLDSCDGTGGGGQTIHTGGSYDDSFSSAFDIGDSVTPVTISAGSYCSTAPKTQLAVISDNTYGQFFAYGKSHDFLDQDFADDDGKKYTGLQLEWRKVLQQHGPGRYQVVIAKTDVFGNAVGDCDPRVFCLKPYHCNHTDNTVRIEVVNQGLRGSLFDLTTQVDYAGGWYNQYRLKGSFMFRGSSYVKEYSQYGDKSFNRQKPIINEQQPKYVLVVRPVPGWMDWILSTDILQADEITVSDYCLRNRHKLIGVPVMNDGDMTPRDNKWANMLSDVEINFMHGYNNLRLRNSG